MTIDLRGGEGDPSVLVGFGPANVVAVRSATADDVERIVEIMHDEPTDEAIALMGSVDLARRYGKGLVELEHIPDPTRLTVVAQESDRVVGVLQYAIGQTSHHSRLDHLRLLATLVGPVGVLRRVPGLWGRMRVEIPIPAGSFYIANIDVDPARRGQGIGTQLLEWAEREAEWLGARSMSLVTWTGSRAIPLYERRGYKTTRTATDPTYERHLHIAGRLLMEKQLHP